MQLSRPQVLTGVLLALLLLITLFAFASRTTAPELQAPPTSQEAQTDTEREPVPEPETRIVRETTEPTALKSAVEPAATATLTVDGARYALTAPEGATLKDAMDRLQGESDFTYSYRNYSGLGALVTHINGRASTGDLVWILHVNGEKSGTGISSTRIRSGDVIEWKLEESY